MSGIAEKYATQNSYRRALMSRSVLRGVLRPLAHWKPMAEPAQGYSVVVGVPWQLWSLVDIPLRSLERATRKYCSEVILAIDTTMPIFEKAYGADVLEKTLARFPSLHARAIFYNGLQQTVTRAINWNWVDCWLTWVLGLADATTRHVLFHDFDAVVVDPEFLDRHYQLALQSDKAFVGLCEDPSYEYFHGQRILMTIELMVDAAALREKFRPIDLFNRVRRLGAARIECDIFRDVQLRMPGSWQVNAVPETQIVHPSQMVSQWHQLQRAGGGGGTAFRPAPCTPLMVIPYFRFLGGAGEDLARITHEMEAGRMRVTLEGRPLDLSGIDAPGREWIAVQIMELERYFAGAPREKVMRYCAAIRGIGQVMTQPAAVAVRGPRA